MGSLSNVSTPRLPGIRHRDWPIIEMTSRVPDYQTRGIEVVDDLYTFPEFTTVGTILGPGR